VTLSCTPVQPLVVPVPRYPAILRSVVAEGDVPVRITVGRSGEVQALRVDTQFIANPVGRELLALTVQRAVRDAHFAPARRFGAAIRSETDLVYRFALTRPSEPPRADEVAGKADSLPAHCPSSSPSVIVVCVPAYPSRARILY
jgi:TonB family protein